MWLSTSVAELQILTPLPTPPPQNTERVPHHWRDTVLNSVLSYFIWICICVICIYRE